MYRAHRTILAAAILGVFSTAAMAADDFITGVYLKSATLCDQAKKNTLKPLIDSGQMVLSAKGFDTTGSDCAFMQVIKHPRTAKAWLATGFCEEPGFASPDVFSIIERKPGQIDVASIAEGATGGMVGDEGDGTVDDGTGAANSNTTTPQTPEDIAAEFANSGISGTYFLCDGVTLP